MIVCLLPLEYKFHKGWDLSDLVCRNNAWYIVGACCIDQSIWKDSTGVRTNHTNKVTVYTMRFGSTKEPHLPQMNCCDTETSSRVNSVNVSYHVPGTFLST